MNHQRGAAAGELRNLVHERLFRYLLDLEVQKALRLQYCLSLICLTPDRLPGETEVSLTRRIAKMVVGRLRRTDIGATLSPGAVALMLIDAEPRYLAAIFSRTANSVDDGRWFVYGDQRVSVSAGASSYPQTARTGNDLLRQARTLMSRARREGGNRLYVPPLTA